jgi:hypothetical protein
MKKLILILLVIATISCDWDRHPVQEITQHDNATDIIAYAPGEYDADSTYYCLTTRYRDCRITDYGTSHFIDSIMAPRYSQVITLQKEYDALQTHAEKTPNHE